MKFKTQVNHGLLVKIGRPDVPLFFKCFWDVSKK